MHVHTPTCMQHALLTQLTSAAHLHAPRCQVPPSSPNEHLKIAFFFRNSVKGERLAKRALVGVDDANEELLAQRRAEVQQRAYLSGRSGTGFPGMPGH